MITIFNEFVSATFSEIGAELKSFKCDGKEQIWYGDPQFWTGSSPVLFPICSGLKDDEFIYEGKTYTMQKHGFARRAKFDVEKVDSNTVTFLLSSDNCPQDNYPFKYEFRIVYTLVGKKLNVEYNIRNLTDGDMYFSVGAHEAYNCPEGIDNYEIIFDQKENLDAYQLVGPLLSSETINYGKDTDTLQLDHSLFSNDCLIFKNLNSRGVILRNKTTGQQVKTQFEGFPYLLIWTAPGAPFICIEPWCGITDSTETGKQLIQKEGIEKIEKGGSFYRIHSFEIL
ncbi:MAG: aldose 1-epimerase family protein [Ruminococcaceae bacterium]|nr:aldose 1-epimerase family protein [Oscillospiraceae bacterium]